MGSGSDSAYRSRHRRPAIRPPLTLSEQALRGPGLAFIGLLVVEGWLLWNVWTLWA
jgi:hypothetical protein